MKTTILLVALSLLVGTQAEAQFTNPVLYTSSAPTGACTSLLIYKVTTTGVLYNCQGGTWTVLSAASGSTPSGTGVGMVSGGAWTTTFTPTNNYIPYGNGSGFSQSSSLQWNNGVIAPNITKSVTEFGVLCDGVTDQTVQLQQALNWAAAQAAPVTLTGCKGTTIISKADQNSLYVSSNLTLDGLNNWKITTLTKGSGQTFFQGTGASTTATIATGTNTATVASAVGIDVGSAVEIIGAGGAHGYQYTTLSGAINTSACPVLAAVTGLPTAGDVIIGSEFIHYTGISTNTLTPCTRGYYGSTAASHTSGDTVSGALGLVTQVLGISGTTLTLKDNASASVTGALLFSGPHDVTIRRLLLDGNHNPSGPIAGGSGIYIFLGNRITAEECDIRNFDSGAVFLDASMFSSIRNNVLRNIGIPSTLGNTPIFLMHTTDTIITGNRTGVDFDATKKAQGGSGALDLDVRTDIYHTSDGPSSRNIIANNHFVVPAIGISLEGGNNNVITSNEIILDSTDPSASSSPGSGIQIVTTQGFPASASVPSNNNIITNNQIIGFGYGIWITGDAGASASGGNQFSGNTISATDKCHIFANGTTNTIVNDYCVAGTDSTGSNPTLTLSGGKINLGPATVDLTGYIQTPASIGSSTIVPTRSGGTVNYPDIYGSTGGICLADVYAHNTQICLQNGKIKLFGIPTSSTGLASGDLWLNSNALMRVP